MPSSRPRASRGPEGPRDDLKRIAGIGPAVAKKLESAGIRTYAAVAESSPDALAEVIAGVAGTSTARIEEMDWIGQAQRLRDARRDAPQAEPELKPEHRSPVRVTRLEGSVATPGGMTVVSMDLAPGDEVTEVAECVVELTARTERGDEIAIARFAVRVHRGRSHSIGAGGPPLPPGRHAPVARIAGAEPQPWKLQAPETVIEVAGEPT